MPRFLIQIVVNLLTATIALMVAGAVIDGVTVETLREAIAKHNEAHPDQRVHELGTLAQTALETLVAEQVTDPARIAQAVRRAVGKWVGETYRRQPMIVPTVLEV